MKKLFAALLCSLVGAAPAFAGEDSTDRWGDGGTGPSVFESRCGLADFKGEDSPMPEKCRPVRSARSVRASGTQYADSSAAAGATRSDASSGASSSRGFGAGSEAREPAESLNDSFHYPTSN